MKQLLCEMCGGTDLIKQDGVFVCRCCGCKYTVEEAKKMMADEAVDIIDTVKTDNTKELSNLYELARRARNDKNSEYARKYYDLILLKDPSSWEATFYSVYYQSINCKIGQIENAAVRLSNCEATVLGLLKENVLDLEYQKTVVGEMAVYLIYISKMLFNVAKNHYNDFCNDLGASNKEKYTQEVVRNCCASRDIVYNFGDYLTNFFGDTYGKIAAMCWSIGVDQHEQIMHYFAKMRCFSEIDKSKTIIFEYIAKIKSYDESYQPPKINPYAESNGCYVATAVYGSYDCPQVWTLRRYRDYTLAETWYGRAFIHTYYAISPTIVKWFGHTEWFKKMWKGKLDRMVANLNAEGVEDTPYKDKLW